MKWVLLFLAVSVNILAGAAAYRVWAPPETSEVIDRVYQKALALRKDHVTLEHQHLILFKQLMQCKGRSV